MLADLLLTLFIWIGDKVLGVALGRPRAGIRYSAFPWKGVGLGALPRWHAGIHIHNAGRAPFTVREAGWIAADGEELHATLGDGRRLEAGGPELIATVDRSTLVELMKNHRGLSWAYVGLVGQPERRRFPVSNAWRQELTAAAEGDDRG